MFQGDDVPPDVPSLPPLGFSVNMLSLLCISASKVQEGFNDAGKTVEISTGSIEGCNFVQ